MKHYRTTLAVHEALESQSKISTCQQCRRPDVRVYPYVSLMLCAGCIVAAGQHG